VRIGDPARERIQLVLGHSSRITTEIYANSPSLQKQETATYNSSKVEHTKQHEVGKLIECRIHFGLIAEMAKIYRDTNWFVDFYQAALDSVDVFTELLK
jgi:hypothetical protein